MLIPKILSGSYAPSHSFTIYSPNVSVPVDRVYPVSSDKGYLTAFRTVGDNSCMLHAVFGDSGRGGYYTDPKAARNAFSAKITEAFTPGNNPDVRIKTYMERVLLELIDDPRTPQKFRSELESHRNFSEYSKDSKTLCEAQSAFNKSLASIIEKVMSQSRLAASAEAQAVVWELVEGYNQRQKALGSADLITATDYKTAWKTYFDRKKGAGLVTDTGNLRDVLLPILEPLTSDVSLKKQVAALKSIRNSITEKQAKLSQYVLFDPAIVGAYCKHCVNNPDYWFNIPEMALAAYMFDVPVELWTLDYSHQQDKSSGSRYKAVLQYAFNSGQPDKYLEYLGVELKPSWTGSTKEKVVVFHEGLRGNLRGNHFFRSGITDSMPVTHQPDADTSYYFSSGFSGKKSPERLSPSVEKSSEKFSLPVRSTMPPALANLLMSFVRLTEGGLPEAVSSETEGESKEFSKDLPVLPPSVLRRLALRAEWIGTRTGGTVKETGEGITPETQLKKMIDGVTGECFDFDDFCRQADLFFSVVTPELFCRNKLLAKGLVHVLSLLSTFGEKETEPDRKLIPFGFYYVLEYCAALACKPMGREKERGELITVLDGMFKTVPQRSYYVSDPAPGNVGLTTFMARIRENELNRFHSFLASFKAPADRMITAYRRELDEMADQLKHRPVMMFKFLKEQLTGLYEMSRRSAKMASEAKIKLAVLEATVFRVCAGTTWAWVLADSGCDEMYGAIVSARFVSSFSVKNAAEYSPEDASYLLRQADMVLSPAMEEMRGCQYGVLREVCLGHSLAPLEAVTEALEQIRGSAFTQESLQEAAEARRTVKEALEALYFLADQLHQAGNLPPDAYGRYAARVIASCNWDAVARLILHSHMLQDWFGKKGKRRDLLLKAFTPAQSEHLKEINFDLSACVQQVLSKLLNNALSYAENFKKNNAGFRALGEAVNGVSGKLNQAIGMLALSAPLPEPLMKVEGLGYWTNRHLVKLNEVPLNDPAFESRALKRCVQLLDFVEKNATAFEEPFSSRMLISVQQSLAELTQLLEALRHIHMYSVDGLDGGEVLADVRSRAAACAATLRHAALTEAVQLLEDVLGGERFNRVIKPHSEVLISGRAEKHRVLDGPTGPVWMASDIQKWIARFYKAKKGEIPLLSKTPAPSEDVLVQALANLKKMAAEKKYPDCAALISAVYQIQQNLPWPETDERCRGARLHCQDALVTLLSGFRTSSAALLHMPLRKLVELYRIFYDSFNRMYVFQNESLNSQLADTIKVLKKALEKRLPPVDVMGIDRCGFSGVLFAKAAKEDLNFRLSYFTESGMLTAAALDMLEGRAPITDVRLGFCLKMKPEQLFSFLKQQQVPLLGADQVLLMNRAVTELTAELNVPEEDSTGRRESINECAIRNFKEQLLSLSGPVRQILYYLSDPERNKGKQEKKSRLNALIRAIFVTSGMMSGYYSGSETNAQLEKQLKTMSAALISLLKENPPLRRCLSSRIASTKALAPSIEATLSMLESRPDFCNFRSKVRTELPKEEAMLATGSAFWNAGGEMKAFYLRLLTHFQEGPLSADDVAAIKRLTHMILHSPDLTPATRETLLCMTADMLDCFGTDLFGDKETALQDVLALIQGTAKSPEKLGWIEHPPVRLLQTLYRLSVRHRLDEEGIKALLKGKLPFEADTVLALLGMLISAGNDRDKVPLLAGFRRGYVLSTAENQQLLDELFGLRYSQKDRSYLELLRSMDKLDENGLRDYITDYFAEETHQTVRHAMKMAFVLSCHPFGAAVLKDSPFCTQIFLPLLTQKEFWELAKGNDGRPVYFPEHDARIHQFILTRAGLGNSHMFVHVTPEKSLIPVEKTEAIFELFVKKGLLQKTGKDENGRESCVATKLLSTAAISLSDEEASGLGINNSDLPEVLKIVTERLMAISKSSLCWTDFTVPHYDHELARGFKDDPGYLAPSVTQHTLKSFRKQYTVTQAGVLGAGSCGHADNQDSYHSELTKQNHVLTTIADGNGNDSDWLAHLVTDELMPGIMNDLHAVDRNLLGKKMEDMAHRALAKREEKYPNSTMSTTVTSLVFTPDQRAVYGNIGDGLLTCVRIPKADPSKAVVMSLNARHNWEDRAERLRILGMKDGTMLTYGDDVRYRRDGNGMALAHTVGQNNERGVISTASTGEMALDTEQYDYVFIHSSDCIEHIPVEDVLNVVMRHYFQNKPDKELAGDTAFSFKQLASSAFPNFMPDPDLCNVKVDNISVVVSVVK